jgi:hypothetical protein
MPHRLPHLGRGPVAHRRAEVDEALAPSILRPSWTKGVSEKVDVSGGPTSGAASGNHPGRAAISGFKPDRRSCASASKASSARSTPARLGETSAVFADLITDMR